MAIGIGAATLGAAGLGVGGGILANRQSAKSTAKSIAFQRELAQNAHQWEVADLRAAGLNPILSAGGPGARASGGAQYKAENVLKEAASTALQYQRTSAEIDNIKANTDNTQNMADINRIEAVVKAKILELGESATTGGGISAAMRNFMQNAERSLTKAFKSTGETQKEFDARIQRKRTPRIIIRKRK